MMKTELAGRNRRKSPTQNFQPKNNAVSSLKNRRNVEKLQEKSNMRRKQLKNNVIKSRSSRKTVNKPRPRATINYYDYTLIFLILFLVAFGLLMIYSASAYTSALKYNGNVFHFVISQGFFACLGILAMFICSKIDYHFWGKFALLGYVVSLGMLIFVSLFGREINGAKRWIYIGPVSIQPSEVAKLAMVLFMAYIINAGIKGLKNIKTLLIYLAMSLPIVGVIAIENLSTAIIVFAIAAAMLFIASPRTAPFLVVGGIGLLGGVIAILSAGYRATRIKVWLHPEAYDQGYQTLQALCAIGSGGLFGKGLGQSMQKLGFIPESHNDMIFSIICEELGIFGALAIVSIFVMVIWRLVIIANNAPDLFGSLLVAGIMTQIATQVIINIAVVTNSIPPTGIPLPFISYGGTSVAILLVEIGIVLGVSRQIKLQK